MFHCARSAPLLYLRVIQHEDARAKFRTCEEADEGGRGFRRTVDPRCPSPSDGLPRRTGLRCAGRRCTGKAIAAADRTTGRFDPPRIARAARAVRRVDSPGMVSGSDEALLRHGAGSRRKIERRIRAPRASAAGIDRQHAPGSARLACDARSSLRPHFARASIAFVRRGRIAALSARTAAPAGAAALGLIARGTAGRAGRTRPVRRTHAQRRCVRPGRRARNGLRWWGRVVPRDGIEPPTLRFSVACSTN